MTDKTLFPYVVEYQYDQPLSIGGAHNTCDGMSRDGAENLCNLLAENKRVRWVCWYKIGQEGNCGEYWR